MKFVIGILGREKYIHSACFEDYAKGLADAIRQAGHETTQFGPDQGRFIAFGCNNVRDPIEAKQMPADAIVFNTEQLAASGVEAQMQSYKMFLERGHLVWDYSESNAQKLRNLGFKVVMCPIGYVPSMKRPNITAYSGEQDIDVLFYGSLNPRRVSILTAIDALGLKLEVIAPNNRFEGQKIQGLYGEARDNVIARSKVVLNLHFYKNPVFEIFRVSHLLANSKCVVTEDGGQDEGLESFARRACRYVHPQKVAEACLELVHDVDLRRKQEEVGHTEFRKLDLVEFARKAVEASL